MEQKNLDIEAIIRQVLAELGKGSLQESAPQVEVVKPE